MLNVLIGRLVVDDLSDLFNDQNHSSNAGSYKYLAFLHSLRSQLPYSTSSRSLYTPTLYQRPAFAMSSRSSSPLDNIFVSSPATTLSTLSTPSPPSPQFPSPNYSLWTAERFQDFPGLVVDHDERCERATWWKYGYRLRDEQRGLTIWVCVDCFKKKSPLIRQYRFVASTSLAIKSHLKKKHHILVSSADSITTSPNQAVGRSTSRSPAQDAICFIQTCCQRVKSQPTSPY